MSQRDQITADEHGRQINDYVEVRQIYEKYANILKDVLEQGCGATLPVAVVQTRAKTVSSFAEKCARAYSRYPDAVRQFTDLCGARVIVQTNEQVHAVCKFVEANFVIIEKDEKGRRLGKDQFGYRDMHYIIALRPDRCEALGISDDDRKEIGSRRAELQVRTWLQHAWADTLHDRIYKSGLPLSAEIRRVEALLSALMENGDRVFDAMVAELDDMIANYAAFADREHVRKEIDVQTVILDNEREVSKKPALALRLAKMHAACGEHERVVELLTKYQDTCSPVRCELLQELGFAQCCVHRAAPDSSEYGIGRKLLEESIALCRQPVICSVPDLQFCEALHARSVARLGRVLEPIQDEAHLAREYLRKATELEPGNPYHLADMLGFEMLCERQAALPPMMHTPVRAALRTCRDHAQAGIELPYAYFTAGRFHLLLAEREEALAAYARGVRYCLEGRYCVPPRVMDREIEWLNRLHFGQPVRDEQKWVLDLLIMAGRAATASPAASTRKTLIVVGGAASADEETLEQALALLEAALEGFSGQVISGGTKTGIPGCLGKLASEMKAGNAKAFELVGYIPRDLPHDVVKDDRYDRVVVCDDDDFSPEQVLQYWSDLLDAKVHPSEVVVLGFGGGLISAIEYRVALALGATVVIVIGTGGEADALLGDPLWADLPNLLPLPSDAASVRALVAPEETAFSDEELKEMGKAFHEQYVSISTHRLPANMRPWPELADTFQRANLDQARHTIRILAACGFQVRPAASPTIFSDFSEDEIERMAELEHGRWNVERLRDGWRPGSRDDAKRLHDCLVSWGRLPDDIKKYDREAVRKYPEILAKAGLEVFRE